MFPPQPISRGPDRERLIKKYFLSFPPLPEREELGLNVLLRDPPVHLAIDLAEAGHEAEHYAVHAALGLEKGNRTFNSSNLIRKECCFLSCLVQLLDEEVPNVGHQVGEAEEAVSLSVFWKWINETNISRK